MWDVGCGMWDVGGEKGDIGYKVSNNLCSCSLVSFSCECGSVARWE